MDLQIILIFLTTCSCMVNASICGPFQCENLCRFGRIFDERGCPTCTCFDPCQGYTCEGETWCEPKSTGRPQCVSEPTFTKRPDDMTVKEDDTFFFSCDTDTDPPIQLKWLFDDGPLPDSPHITTNPSGTILSIVKVRTSHAGTYQCVAEGDWGQMSAGANLTVIPSVPPYIIDTETEIDAVLGSTTTFDCDASGDPDPHVKWLKDGIRVSTGEDHESYCNGTLVFKNVLKQDEGTYTCVAENIGGFEYWNTSLNVRRPGEKTLGVPEGLAERFTYEARDLVTSAVEVTLKAQNDPRNNRTPQELLRFFRYPSCLAQRMAMAADMFEMSIGSIRSRILPSSPKNFVMRDLLSPKQISTLSDMTGCMKSEHTCSKPCSDVNFHQKYRTFDGTCNNFKNPLFGAAVIPLIRLLPADYDNEFNFPQSWDPTIQYNGFRLPSARKASTKIISTKTTQDDMEFSHMLMQWGQFLDHDLDLTPQGVSNMGYRSGRRCNETCEFDPPCFPIPIPPDDPRIKNRDCLSFTRSSAACGISKNHQTLTSRNQINQLTAYIDGSQIYGSSEETANDLREFNPNRGLLRAGIVTAAGKPLLPPSKGQPVDCLVDPNAGNVPCFLAGDGRVNEQLGLIAIQTLWFREHNRVASKLSELNPNWDGNAIYHEARKIVGAELQHITYNEWLPIILGPHGMRRMGSYSGYDPKVDAGISNSFSTAAFRFGHATINPIIFRLDCRFKPIPEGNIPLHQAFFTPGKFIEEGGIDPILRGLYGRAAKQHFSDELLTTELTERLFQLANSVALDLGALNIQRGRDHGLPGYNAFRKFCGLSEARTFDDFENEITNVDVRKKLEDVYGHPDNVDLWVGGLAEDILEGAKVGPTFACILADQMKRSRAGDRFWYENPCVFSPAQLTEIKQATLARVICDNADDIEHVQLNAFRRAEFPDGMVVCSDENVPYVDLRFWSHGCDEGDMNKTLTVPPHHAKFDADSPCKMMPNTTLV